MKRGAFGTLLLLPLLAACGGSPPPPTIQVTCHSGTSVYGISHLDIAPAPGNGALLTYDDPNAPGTKGTVHVDPTHGPCTVGPTTLK